jgi:hypothetical protein
LLDSLAKVPEMGYTTSTLLKISPIEVAFLSFFWKMVEFRFYLFSGGSI